MSFFTTARERFWLVVAAGFLGYQFLRAYVYLEKKAGRELLLPGHASLSRSEWQRFRHYYLGATYLNAIFTCTRGRSRNRSERKRHTLMAALSAFFDDLSEQTPAHPLAEAPEAFSLRTDPRGLTLYWLNLISDGLYVHQRKAFKERVLKVFAQETANPKQPTVHPHVLLHRCLEKGGLSVLLFRYLLDTPLSNREKEALFAFGGLVQLSDDIFDAWFDLRDGLPTMATYWLQRNDPLPLHRLYTDQARQTIAALSRSGIKRSRLAVASIHYLIAATQVCLERYTMLKRKHGTLPLNSRTDMVTDMALWPNRLRAAQRLWRQII